LGIGELEISQDRGYERREGAIDDAKGSIQKPQQTQNEPSILAIWDIAFRSKRIGNLSPGSRVRIRDHFSLCSVRLYFVHLQKEGPGFRFGGSGRNGADWINFRRGIVPGRFIKKTGYFLKLHVSGLPEKKQPVLLSKGSFDRRECRRGKDF